MATSAKGTISPSAMISSGQTAPQLVPYNYNCRGPFNFLRHPGTDAQVPKKPDTAAGKDKPAASPATEKFSESLKKDPFMDFSLWSIEYNDQLDIKDFKSMREIIFKQEAEKGDELGSVSSDTPRPCKVKGSYKRAGAEEGAK